MRAARLGRRGFTLLELLAAIAIFGIMTIPVLINQDIATDRAMGSVRARELRVLAERRLGDVAVFAKEYDDLFDDETFDDYGDQWEGWHWSLDIRDVVIFGETSDENAQYLFGAPDEDDEETTSGTNPGAGNQEKKGETQYLRELTLRVRAPQGDDGESDASVKIVTFLPLVEHGPAAAPPAGGGGGQ